jgi:hypothetical protein
MLAKDLVSQMIVDQMIVDQKKGNHVYGQNLFWLM